jgi:sugar/nucleoside kinase (ribokinase family)
MSLPDVDSPSAEVDWPSVLEHTLPHVDLFVPSAEELLCMLDREAFTRKRSEAQPAIIEPGRPMAGQGREMLDLITTDEVSQMAARCLAMGTRLALVKCGRRGLCVLTAPAPVWDGAGAASPAIEMWHSRALWDPSFHVADVAGATGSGDAAAAGFLASVLRGLSLEDALHMANAVGACNLTAPDAQGGILSWEETAAKVESGWPRNPLDLSEEGWRWDPEVNLWRGPDDRRGP